MAAQTSAHLKEVAPIAYQRGGPESLADTILDVRTRVDDMKAKRALAFLDGQKFDSAPIRLLEEELETLIAAEAELGRRERLAEEAAIERRREAVKAKIREIEPKRIEAIRIAEAAATDFMVALRDVETFSDEMDSLMRSLGFNSDRTHSDGIKERFSRRFTAIMKPILVHGWRQYGSIRFPEPQDIYAREWAEAESALIADHLEQVARL